MLDRMYPVLRRMTLVGFLVAAAATNLGTTIIPLEFERLVDLSESVVRCTVVGTRCEWRTAGESRFIVTMVALRIDETVIGPRVSTLELQFMGGQLDGQSLAIAGQPQFRAGDQDILFVIGNGQSICPLVGMNYGRILVVPDQNGRAMVARDNGAPLRALAELSTPMSEVRTARSLSNALPPDAMSVDDFCAAIRQRALRQGRTDVVPQAGPNGQ